MSQMIRVTRGNKCPICNHDTWCLIGKSAVICMRVQSAKEKLMKGGEVGWIHLLGDEPIPRTEWRKPEREATINARRVLDDWRRAYPDSRLPWLAHDLGVTIKSLEELECQMASGYQNVWGFPMKDGYGNYLGIRLRSYLGKKWAVTGSHAGIFIPQARAPKRILVVEGPTDAAAGLSLGFYTVGRPSCSGGGDALITFVRRNKINEVVLVADNDEPGIRGAKTLQQWLPARSCILVLPCKDLREFIKIGDKSTIDSMIEQLVWTQPKETK